METAGELAARLAPIGGRLFVKTIRGLKDGTLAPIPQDHSHATLAPLLKKEDGMLRWDEEATALANRIRGLTPWPGAYTYYGDERWQIWRAEPTNPGCAMAEPGVILEATRETIRVAAGKGALLIRELRSEEHTSELQSPCNLVCRLLLEKKKKTTDKFSISSRVSTVPKDRPRGPAAARCMSCSTVTHASRFESDRIVKCLL